MKDFPKGSWLLCKPSYFDIKYEINAWMDVSITPEKALAAKQWQAYHDTMIEIGAHIEYIDPHEEVPDIVYTANGGLVKGNKVVISKFRHPERRLEEPYFKRWFEDAEFEVFTLDGDFSFEGAGDALFAGEKLFCGCGFRSDPEAHKEVQKLLGVQQIVLCNLVDPYFYHIDTCFCPLNENEALIHKEAFAPESFDRMSQEIKLHVVPEEDAKRFVCNAVVLDKEIVLPSRCEKTYEMLEGLGFKTHPVEMSEFMKGGGASKCLNLRLDRA